MCDRLAQDAFAQKTYDSLRAEEKLVQDRKDGVVKDDGKMIKPAQLDNCTSPEIINGKPSYAVEKNPFDYCFTYPKIFKS